MREHDSCSYREDQQTESTEENYVEQIDTVLRKRNYCPNADYQEPVGDPHTPGQRRSCRRKTIRLNVAQYHSRGHHCPQPRQSWNLGRIFQHDAEQDTHTGCRVQART